MDNYWLNRKVNRDQYNRSLRRLMAGDSFENRNDEFPDFIDLSQANSAGGRYKAYQDLYQSYHDLKMAAVWEGVPTYLPHHL